MFEYCGKTDQTCFSFQTSVMDLTKLKSDLFHINLEIHNFLADFFSTGRKDQQHRILLPPMVQRQNQTSTNLKDKIIGLYALWDETFHW